MWLIRMGLRRISVLAAAALLGMAGLAVVALFLRPGPADEDILEAGEVESFAIGELVHFEDEGVWLIR